MGKGKSRRNQRRDEDIRYRNDSFEHDDRVDHDMRKVSFKFKNQNSNSIRKKKNYGVQVWDSKIKDFLQDNDIEMSGDRNRGGDRERGGGGKSRNRSYPTSNKSLPESSSPWYRITIVFGNRYEKDYLLKLLANYIKPTPLVPLMYMANQDCSTFIVDERVVAEQLFNVSRRIRLSDGRKLFLKVRPYTPLSEADSKLIDAMKKVMGIRYDASIKMLNLSKFHMDPNFLNENMFCPLGRPNFMMNAIDIMAEFVPDLVALNLSENKLQNLSNMKHLVDKLPRIKSLSLSQNKLRDISSLDVLKGLDLEEINLDGNPLCSRFGAQDDYIRAVRDRLPKVVKLDGIILPPPILFDVGDEDVSNLPTSKPSYMCDPGNGMNVAKMFLEQYYQIYDSEDRSRLLEAYHDDATFSLDCEVALRTGGTSKSDQDLSNYIPHSRNLFRINHIEKRIRQLKKGKLNIVEQLKNLPKTQHDPSSFMVDLLLFSNELINLSVCGLFKERDRPNAGIKYFSRVFLLVPVGSGFCVTNDQLSIIPASAEQLKKIAKAKEAQAAPQPIPGSSGAPLVSNEIAAKQEMVIRLAGQTGMNLTWSEKCLTETNWNYDQALFAFTHLQKTGSVPAEAFVKQ